MQFFVGIVPPEEISKRLRAEFRYATEPHITVKAQSGLTAEGEELWRPAIKSAVQWFGGLEVALCQIRSFGGRVAFLSVHSGRIFDLHRLIVRLVGPTQDQMRRYHELDGYNPHLTLCRGKDLDLSELGARVDKVLPIPPFHVGSVWLFKQDVDGRPYRRYEEFSLT